MARRVVSALVLIWLLMAVWIVAAHAQSVGTLPAPGAGALGNLGLINAGRVTN